MSKALIPPPAADGCENSELCTQQAGSKSLCRARGTPCIPLETPDCSEVQGQWQAPNSLIIGTIGAHTLRLFNGGAARLAWAPRAMRAMDLGLSEWNEKNPQGLSASRSALALVHCNSNGDADQIARVLDHLTRTVRVRALIAMSDVERNAIADRASELDIPVVCAGCYERAQGASTSGVGTWRMQSPLEDQARLVAQRTQDLEQQIRSERALTKATPIRVALLGQDSPGNKAFIGAVRALLRFNGDLTVAGQSEGNFREVPIPDPSRQGIDSLELSRQLVAFQPDVLIAGMDSDFAAAYLPTVEQEWPPEQPRPFYIVTVQNRNLGLLETIASKSDDLHRRLSGTAPLTSPQVAQNRDAFVARFLSAHREPAEETESAYDAFYATAYALYVAALEQQYGADRFAYGLQQLTDGPGFNVGRDEIWNAEEFLLNGESINLVGSSSELDWDVSSGGVNSDTTLWCLSRDAAGNLRIQDDAGVHWSRTTDEITGIYACPPPTTAP